MVDYKSRAEASVLGKSSYYRHGAKLKVNNLSVPSRNFRGLQPVLRCAQGHRQGQLTEGIRSLHSG